jgi:hypothetical protein
MQSTRARQQRAAAAASQAHGKEKEAREDKKAIARAKLDDNTKQVIGGYEKTINGLLDDFLGRLPHRCSRRRTGTTCVLEAQLSGLYRTLYQFCD